MLASKYNYGMDDEALSSLDPGIRGAVLALRHGGVETFESCEGGRGHCYPEPTVRFFGEVPEGFRALSVALAADLPVYALRRVWKISEEKEPAGPWWELTFFRRPAGKDGEVITIDGKFP